VETALARLSAARTEILVLSLHDRAGEYICSYEYPGNRGSIELRYRALIAIALSHHAHRILLMHNHPSGVAVPSAQDIMATAGLKALCRPLDIDLHDHLVIGGGVVVSMRRAGLFAREGGGR
jgi:DNA repair protein RadC